MKVISKSLIILWLFFAPFAIKAHQPDLSCTLLIEQEKDKWILQIRANSLVLFNKKEQTILKSGLVKLGHETIDAFEVRG